MCSQIAHLAQPELLRKAKSTPTVVVRVSAVSRSDQRGAGRGGPVGSCEGGKKTRISPVEAQRKRGVPFEGNGSKKSGIKGPEGNLVV